jgi:8-oxo-dGTP pyrophosphatase MutT (NUDIX family)
MIDYIKDRLNSNLPGIDSQRKMSVSINGKPFKNIEPTKSAKFSSVLLLLKIENDKIYILFTLRSEKLKSHSGQISFPGGRIDNGESELDAALRETYEEVGITKENIEILGNLSTLYVPPSNSNIYPFVGVLKDNNIKLILSESEVEEAFFAPIDFFLDRANVNFEKWDREGNIYDVPVWHLNKRVPLWGATAMILSEFLDILH